MPIRVLFWNIEKFRGDDPDRAQRVVDHVRETDPDIIGFSEITDKAALRSILQSSLADYDFGITDGVEQIELLAGWRRGGFGQALFTQRREFKADNPWLRPGSLLSVMRDDRFYNFLFLHTDSGRKNKDYNNRQDMFEKIWAMRQRLNQIEGQDSNFLAIGDLNTMGRNARSGAAEITADQEIANLAQDARQAGMELLDKTHPDTWAEVRSNGSIKRASNLDHVIAASHLEIADNIATVRGWVEAGSDAERKTFVETISDHCSVECVINTP